MADMQMNFVYPPEIFTISDTFDYYNESAMITVLVSGDTSDTANSLSNPYFVYNAWMAGMKNETVGDLSMAQTRALYSWVTA